MDFVGTAYHHCCTRSLITCAILIQVAILSLMLWLTASSVSPSCVYCGVISVKIP
ncbi:unnamed protein product, partial [Onchocerca flexuosa]|uniref:LITAF domain-containing protein n=1 Tax=Onchocerca flexuosa TaxID=387005 RepID=A0A183H5P6_9BILA